MRKLKKKKVESHAKIDRKELEEIISTLQKNDELNRKNLQKRKNKEI